MSEDIFKKVQETLSQALGVEPSEVELTSSLTQDLGAESIDFIDIIFRLEKSFDLKIPTGDLFPANLMNDPEMVKEGKVTETGLVELQKRLPYVDLAEFSKDPQVTKLADHFKVEMLIRYLEDRIKEKSESSSDAASSQS